MIKNSQSFIDFNFNKTNGNHFLFEITVKRFWRFLYINFCPIFSGLRIRQPSTHEPLGSTGARRRRLKIMLTH
jgi:hypothetical protein